MSVNISDRNNPKLFANRFPKYAKFLLNSEDGYKYYGMSAKKVDWICPYCNNIVRQIPINKITTRHRIPCKRCSDGISYPNKVMSNILLQLKEDFITEYSPEWVKPKRFDFFIPSKKIIIEMDGAIGHGNKSFNGAIDSNLLNIDIYKDNLANEHEIDVIRIDCSISDIQYIKEKIIQSKLAAIYELSKIDWDKCDKDSLSSLQIVVCDLWNNDNDIPMIVDKTKLSRITVTRYLHRCAELGRCDYNSKIQYQLSGKRNIPFAYNKNKKAVVCLDTNEIFESCRKAYEWLGYNPDGHSIQDNCNGINKSAGKHPITKEKLHWAFYDEELLEVG